MGAAEGEYVVDHLSGAGGSAEAESIEAFLPWFADVCGAEDQLLAELVYGGGSNQYGRVGDAEVMQDALDRARACLCIVGFDSAGSCWPFAMISPSRLLVVRARVRMWLGARTSAAIVATAAVACALAVRALL